MNGSKVYQSTIADNGLSRSRASTSTTSTPTRSATSSPTTSGSGTSTPARRPRTPATPPRRCRRPATRAPRSSPTTSRALVHPVDDRHARAGMRPRRIQTARPLRATARRASVTENAASKAGLSKRRRPVPERLGQRLVRRAERRARTRTATCRCSACSRARRGSSTSIARTAAGSCTCACRTERRFTYTSLGRILALNRWYRVKVHVDASGGASTVGLARRHPGVLDQSGVVRDERDLVRDGGASTSPRGRVRRGRRGDQRLGVAAPMCGAARRPRLCPGR